MVGYCRAKSRFTSQWPCPTKPSMSSTHHERIIGSSVSIDLRREERRQQLAILRVLGRVELLRDHAPHRIGLRWHR